MNKIAANMALTATAIVLPCGMLIAATIIIIRRNTNLLDKITGDMRISTKGINLIKQYEGCRLTAYKDSVGIWTIGYGHTSGVKQGDTCTADQAESYLKSDLRTAENAINTMGVELTQNQFDALVSFVFNLGVGNFKSSTLYKKIKANPNDPTISDEFSKWKYAGGKELTGLLNRRNAESGLYFA